MANEIPPPIVRFRRIARIAALVSTGWAASGVSPSGAGAQEPVDLSDPRTVPETEPDVPLGGDVGDTEPGPPVVPPPPTPPVAEPPRAAAPMTAPPPAPPPSSGVGRAEYTVVPGDTLWSIAKELLGPSAAPAEIAREVDRLWRLNADTIGRSNPNLIHAGVVLRLR
jgi:nucleoid-associated protein YgaU